MLLIAHGCLNFTSGVAPSETVIPDRSVDGFTFTAGSDDAAADGDAEADGDADAEAGAEGDADADADDAPADGEERAADSVPVAEAPGVGDALSDDEQALSRETAVSATSAMEEAFEIDTRTMVPRSSQTHDVEQLSKLISRELSSLADGQLT